MNLYNLTVKGIATERYSVEAKSEDEARAKFEEGNISAAYSTEVYDCEIERVDLEEEDV